MNINIDKSYKNDTLTFILSLNNTSLNQLILDIGSMFVMNLIDKDNSNNSHIKNINDITLNNQEINIYQTKVIDLYNKIDVMNDQFNSVISKSIQNNINTIQQDQNNRLIELIKDNNNNKSLTLIEDKINNINTTFSTYFDKFIKGNIEKGNFGEKFIENYLYDKFSSCSITDTHKETSFGDLIFSYGNMKLMIESKNVQSCKKEDFNKFFKDFDLRSKSNEINSGLFISLNDTNLLNNTRYFNFQFRNNKPIILISNVFNNPEFIRFSIILLEHIILFLKNQDHHFDINTFISHLNNILSLVMNQFEYIDNDRKLISKLQISLNNREKDLNIIHQQILNLIENNSEKKINTIQSIESSIIDCINDKLKEDKSFKINLKNLQDLNISSYDIKKIGGIKAITNKIKNDKQIII